MRNALLIIVFSLAMVSCSQTEKTASTTGVSDTSYYEEKYRPQLHFSPQANWMNDPNGMVFHNNEYHLFYQYYPQGTTWGPMHWGHAVTSDLVHWQHLPVALYPDSLGYIFSGSAVVDTKNTSGFGTGSKPPLVAIFTYHDAVKEKAGTDDFQTQGIAYSNDNGRSWEKYKGNPVLKNQGIRDFRDPKVFWYEDSKQWVMILAVKDHVELWGSPNLKEWKKLSDFGTDYGSHGGVWECPDLFQLPVTNGHGNKWVMLLSINPGGPNKGSATQYFIGDFDGRKFTADTGKKDTVWVDYGPDNYAGVTFSNVPDGRRIFLGWMSNWDYAQVVPTERWRSAMTVPRDLSLHKIGDVFRISSAVSPEFLAAAKPENVGSKTVSDSVMLNSSATDDLSKSIITGVADASNFTIDFTNTKGQRVMVGYNADKRIFYIDRSASGDVSFSDKFTGRVTAPRFVTDKQIPFTIVSDHSSLEVFFDNGLSAMTVIFFPDEPLSRVSMNAPSPIQVSDLQIRRMKSVWKK